MKQKINYKEQPELHTQSHTYLGLKLNTNLCLIKKWLQNHHYPRSGCSWRLTPTHPHPLVDRNLGLYYSKAKGILLSPHFWGCPAQAHFCPCVTPQEVEGSWQPGIPSPAGGPEGQANGRVCLASGVPGTDEGDYRLPWNKTSEGLADPSGGY